MYGYVGIDIDDLVLRIQVLKAMPLGMIPKRKGLESLGSRVYRV